MGGNRRRQQRIILLALSLVTVVMAGACSASENRSTSDDSKAPDPQAESVAQAPAGAAGNPDTASTDGKRIERSIIYTGSIHLTVGDVDQVASRVVEVATGAGGYVGGDQRSGTGDTSEAELRLRIPAARFSAVLDEIARLGKANQRDVKTEDVTEETIDLAARIATQRARVASGRKLLARAENLNELITLEGEVAKREADLAALEAKQRRLADLTALSTLTVNLARQEPEPEDQTGFLAGWHGGLDALFGTLVVLVTVLGALLPWLLVFGVPLFLLRRWIRRRRAARPARTPSGAAPTTSGGPPTTALYGAAPTPPGGPPATAPYGPLTPPDGPGAR